MRKFLYGPDEPGAGGAVAPPPAVTPPPAPAPAPARTPEFNDVDFGTSVEYADESGKMVSHTIGELVEAQARASQFADMDIKSLKNLSGLMRNDPEATKAVLQQQLDDLNRQTAPTVAPNAEMQAMKQQILKLEAMASRGDRVTQTVEFHETRSQLEHALNQTQISAALPWLASNPAGKQKAAHAIVELRRRADQMGQQIDNRQLVSVLQQVENEIRSIASPYGLTAPTVPPPNLAQDVTMGALSPTANDKGGELTQKARLTPQDLLNARLGQQVQQPQQAQSAGMGVVPEAGGVVGGRAVVGGQPNGSTRYGSEGLRQKIRQQIAAQEGQQ